MGSVCNMNGVPVFKKIKIGCVTWVLLAQDLIQWRGSYEHCNEPLGFIKGGGSRSQFSRNILLHGVTVIVNSDMKS
jgi:hypothetical protein